jgi:hypothetical protein
MFVVGSVSWTLLNEKLNTEDDTEKFCAPQWQPIETAPKDMGARLFLCDGIALDGFVDATGDFCVRSERYPGWRKMRRAPTHWMPLPEDPQ